MLPALHLVQEELGWIPRDAITIVAKHLRLSEAQVYGAVTFYSEFREIPPPGTLVVWCSGPSCRIAGGGSIKAVLEAEFGCRLGENAPGDAYGLWLGQCNGTCERAPQIWVNGRVIGPLTVAEVVRLARRVKAGAQVVPPPAAPDADLPIAPWRGAAEQRS